MDNMKVQSVSGSDDVQFPHQAGWHVGWTDRRCEEVRSGQSVSDNQLRQHRERE